MKVKNSGNLVELTHLDLADNELKLIELTDFKTNTKLETLNLNNNQLRYIHREAFIFLTNLKVCFLTNSVNRALHKNVDLQYLNLGSNDLSDPYVNQLMIPEPLEFLSLQAVQLTTLDNPTIRTLQNLTYLDLSRNGIEHISPDALAGSKNSLVYLDLTST